MDGEILHADLIESLEENFGILLLPLLDRQRRIDCRIRFHGRT